jgi:hypothetical protein
MRERKLTISRLLKVYAKFSQCCGSDPVPTSIDADPDTNPDPTPRFTHTGKSDFFYFYSLQYHTVIRFVSISAKFSICTLWVSMGQLLKVKYDLNERILASTSVPLISTTMQMQI